MPVVIARNFESGSAALHERDDFQRIGALELRLRTLGARHDLTIELDSHAVGAQALAFDQFGTVIGVAMFSSLPLMIIAVPFCVCRHTCFLHSDARFW